MMTKGLVTFTFDDGISKNFELLLDILKVEDIKATLFVIGETINHGNIHLLKRAFDEGHCLGDHTWSHKNLTKISDEDIVEELTKTRNKIQEAVPVYHVKYCRPPYGAINAHAKSKIVELGYQNILWDVDPRDWDRKRSKEEMMSYYHSVFDKADPAKHSYIILQHDLRRDSVELVPEIASLVVSKGFKIVSLDEYLEG
jgi:peptidoglycan/xylan/chitin deacetylase (PgdA/CDA1 family)